MGIFRFAQLHRLFDMVYAHLYVGVMVVGVLWWGPSGNKMSTWGQCTNLLPTYLTPTKWFEPTSSDYTRP